MNKYLPISVSELLLLLFICLNGCTPDQKEIHQPATQIPSPTMDSIRVRARIENKNVPGLSFKLENVLTRPVEIYVTDHNLQLQPVNLLIHFHGAGYVPRHAVYQSGRPFILATVNLGSGSSVYENPFRDQTAFPELVKSVINSVSKRKSVAINISKTYLSSFSAGYGAVREILKSDISAPDGIILLDGLHTDYIPAGRTPAQGGALNGEKMRDFVQFARLAADGQKKFLITHSEIYPGAYASTTETADFIINSLKLNRRPVLKHGPVGMQQLSETNVKGLTILGFTGNTAPDHIDHFHSLPTFLEMIMD